MTWAMLAWRHFLVRPLRTLIALLGYAIGVAVMIVLLSVGDAMLDQSRDTALVGGGELTVLPQGIDREALRSGGLTGMFFGIDGAHFVVRQLLGGPRQMDIVRALSPALEQKRLMLQTSTGSWVVRAGADLPGAATIAGDGLHVLRGSWHDDSADVAWAMPSRQVLYDEIDHFHFPTGRDSSWAEWHYANIVVSKDEWWYLTLLIGGDLRGDAWGGQVIATHRRPDGTYRRFQQKIGHAGVAFDTARADITLGASRVTQRDGIYHFAGQAGALSFDVMLTPTPNRYFPAINLGTDAAPSGYAVAALTGTASGRLCDGRDCRIVHDAVAYHDHNWGRWTAATWEWGAARSDRQALLYGGVLRAGESSGHIPFFLVLEDSLGVRQLYRFRRIERFGARTVSGTARATVPDSFRIVATRAADTLTLDVGVLDAVASMPRATGPGHALVQIRGKWRTRGRAAGMLVADSGTGFFETWDPRPGRARR